MMATLDPKRSSWLAKHGASNSAANVQATATVQTDGKAHKSWVKSMFAKATSSSDVKAEVTAEPEFGDREN